MGQEIERKFLIDHAKWQQEPKPPGDIFRQGYLVAEPGKTIRVRLTGKNGYLTIKGITTGASRAEYEYEIPKEEATELLDQFAISELSKTRYKIVYEGKTWEVDEFSGDNEGLIIAEIELVSEDESFAHPAWLGEEVTGDHKYYNSHLATHPFKSW